MNDTRDYAARLARLVAVLAVAVSGGCNEAGESEDHRGTGQVAPTDSDRSEIGRLEQRIARLESIAPGQGALMGQLGYHFGNLWFALDYENWPLAGFYLHECRETLEQAVRVRPARTLSTGGELNLQGIAEALDNTQFAELARAIEAKGKARAVAVYQDTMIVCYSCHQAAEMSFLRMQLPDKPPSPSISFDLAQNDDR